MNLREKSYRRILLIFGIFFGSLAILAGQVFRIQILNYVKLSRSVTEQRQSVLINNKLRGLFLDRNGNNLRNTKDNWYLVIQKDLFNYRDATKLTAIFGAGFLNTFNKQPGTFWIYYKTLTDFQIKSLVKLNIEGLKIIDSINRNDSNNPLAWHLLGFVNRGQGLSGLEYLYDSILDNRNSKLEVFTINDGWHHFIPGLGLRTSCQRNNAMILLTLDREIQALTEKMMDRNHMQGAIVILDATTGDILAMASRPLVNLDNLATSISDNHNNPFLNRAVSAYHPGSIFKLIILAAGLDSGQLNLTDTFFDPGYFETGDRKYCAASQSSGRGLLNLTDALAYSCNPVFIQIALKLKPALILKYADNFGLGQPCNIGLRDESWGELPTGLDFSVGDQVNMALGEGSIYTTPLQIASLVQTIANNGIRLIPRLVLGYKTHENELRWLESNPPVRVIQTETARVIQKMMAAVIGYGTGKEAQVYGGAAGKTGTAQNGTDGKLIDHAWFAGYAPLDSPRYVAAIFCEKGISGGKTAAPIFKEIMEQLIESKDLKVKN